MNVVYRPSSSKRHQRGQALIYGIFILATSLSVLYFMFNTGQVAQEKTKLVNTADAVAYTAGVLHARALNFDAYSNRALVANEVLFAQMVSLASWAKYASAHVDGLRGTSSATLRLCNTPASSYYGGPFVYVAGRAGIGYAALCNVLAEPQLNVGDQLKAVANAVLPVTQTIARAIELDKTAIRLAQATLHNPLAMTAARAQAMENVAKANYPLDGGIAVDPVALGFTDEWAGFTQMYTGTDRKPYAEMVRNAAYDAVNGDNFTRERRWRAEQHIVPQFVFAFNCAVRGRTNFVQRDGGTTMSSDYDSWQAFDRVEYTEHRNRSWFRCGTRKTMIANEGQNAIKGGSATDWGFYSGLPNFRDLSTAMLAKTSSLKPGAAATLRFTARVRRLATQARTSDGTSVIKNTSRLNPYKSDAAESSLTGKPEMTQIATSEVFFQRPPAERNNVFGTKSGKPNELGSLFNPYWQVRLATPSTTDMNMAATLQKTVLPPSY